MARQSLISLSSHLPEKVMLEEARKWVSYMLPKISVNIVKLDGTVKITEVNAISEIERVTGVIPKSVRLRGKSKFGAPCRTWLVFLKKKRSQNRI